MTEIKLLINEKEIPLNPIMSTILTKINLGFMEALKNLPDDKKTITIEIKL